MGPLITNVTASVPVEEAKAKRSAQDIQQEIEARREAISETIDRLDERIQRAIDWRSYVADHPLMAIGIAAGAGLLLSGIFQRRPTPGERIRHAIAESVEEITDQARGQLSEWTGSRPRQSALKGALAAMVTKAATSYLSNKLRGAWEPHATPRNNTQMEGIWNQP